MIELAKDQITIVDVTDAYSVTLSKETYVFGGTSTAAIPATVGTQIYARIGAADLDCYVVLAEITKPSGVTVTQDDDPSKPTLYISVDNTVNTNGVVTIPVHVGDVTIIKQFTFSIAFAGTPGGTGVGVLSIVEEYYSSTSASVQTGGSWVTSPPAWVDGRYIWTRSRITYTDTTQTTTMPVNVTGGSGSSGDSGRSIVSVDVWYYLSDSSATLTGGSWSTTAPTWVDGKYMWSKTIVTYDSGPDTESAPVCITGGKGATGSPGADAKSIDLTAVTQILRSPSGGGATTPATTIVTGTATNTTISVWQYSVNGAAFSATVPAGVSRSGNVVTITGTTMTAATIAVRMADAGGVSDTLTVAKIFEGADGTAGADAYTVVLTNESHTFAGDVNNALAGSTTTSFVAYKGATLQSVTVGTITGQVTGLTTAITNNGTTSTLVTITVTTSLTATNGTLTIPLTIDGKSFTKQLTWAVSRKGTTGKGISSAEVRYAASGSGISPPASGWQVDPPSLTPGQYLWTRVIYTYSDATTTTTYSVGMAGATGKGISSSTIHYAVSASGTVVPTTGWDTSIPTVPPGQYLWTRTILTYSDSTTSTSYSISLAGANGTPGVSITGMIRYYYLATTAPAKPTNNPPGGSWTATEPTYTAGSANDLFFTDLILFSAGSPNFLYSDVQKSSSYAAAKLAYNEAQSAKSLANNAQTTADGKNRVVRTTTDAANPELYQAGDQWWKYSGSEAIKLWIHNGTSWVVTNIDGAVLKNLDAGTINVGILHGDRIGVNSIGPTKLAPEVRSDIDSKATAEYVQSRGTDLVTNGTGLLGTNYNFPGSTFNPADTPIGGGSFVYPAGALSVLTEELIPIDLTKRYVLSTQAKQIGTSTTARMYFGLQPYDVDKQPISPRNYMYFPNTHTTLAVALNPGATKIVLTSSANWQNAAGANTHFRSLIAWNYVDGKGKTWPVGTYSRNAWNNLWADGAIVGNEITLSSPWSGPALPAGNPVSNGSSGGSYMYSVENQIVPQTWTPFSGAPIGGQLTGTQPQSAVTQFPYGTSFVKIVFLKLSNTNDATSTIALAAVSFSDASAAQYVASNAQTTANNKSKIFTSTPTIPYSVGDTWMDSTNNIVRVCTTARATGSYTASDWTATAVRNFYGSSNPTPPYSVGDIWHDQVNNIIRVCTVAKATGASYAVSDWTVSGVRNFVGATGPTPPYSVGDTWTDQTNNVLKICTTARATGSYTASDWVEAVKTADQIARDAAAAVDGRADFLNNKIDLVQVSADGKSKQYYSSTIPPVGAGEYNNDDTWYQFEPSTQTILGQWKYSGDHTTGSWEKYQINSAWFSEIDAGKIKAGVGGFGYLNANVIAIQSLSREQIAGGSSGTSLADDIDQINNDTSDLNSRVEKYEDAIVITPSEILMSSDGGDVSMSLTATKLDFRESGQTVAELSGQKLKVKSAEIAVNVGDYLQFGSHIVTIGGTDNKVTIFRSTG